MIADQDELKTSKKLILGKNCRRKEQHFLKTSCVQQQQQQQELYSLYKNTKVE